MALSIVLVNCWAFSLKLGHFSHFSHKQISPNILVFLIVLKRLFEIFVKENVVWFGMKILFFFNFLLRHFLIENVPICLGNIHVHGKLQIQKLNVVPLPYLELVFASQSHIFNLGHKNSSHCVHQQILLLANHLPVHQPLTRPWSG